MNRQTLARTTQISDSTGKIIQIDFDELMYLRPLGHGQYGVVSKMMHKPTNTILAVKVRKIIYISSFVAASFY